MMILYILYYILAYIQHNGDVSLEKNCTVLLVPSSEYIICSPQ